MSLSQKRPTNPAKLFLKTKSKKEIVDGKEILVGQVIYYDKELQENIAVPTPFEFIVLDQLATIKGWSDDDQSGFWSNEVRSVGRDILTVRTSRGMKESGIWRDIKGSPNLAGAKYHSSIYIAHKSNGGLTISNLSLTGAALNAWIEFTQKNRINNVKVILSDWADAKKGSVAYKVPIFEAAPMGEEEKAEAIELDKQLQVYLNEYFNYTPDEGHDSGFASASKDVVLEDIEDEPIDLSTIPF